MFVLGGFVAKSRGIGIVYIYFVLIYNFKIYIMSKNSENKIKSNTL